MQYESKVMRVDFYTKTTMRLIPMTDEQLKEIIDKEGLLGWNLTSTILLGMQLTLIFSRVKKSLAEMV